MLVKSIHSMEDNLKRYLSDPEHSHDLRTAVKLAKEILVHKEDSDYANYALALNEIMYANSTAPLSDFTSSIDRLEKLIKKNPKFLEAYLMLAKVLKETDREKELKVLEQANKIFPDNYLIMYDLATFKLFNTGEKEEALTLFSKCVETLPQIPNNWAMLGTAYVMLRELEMAKVSFETALSLNPEHVNATLGLGVYYFENANFVKAREYYEKSLLINKDSYYAKFNIALLEILQGNFKKGIELHEQRDKKKYIRKYGGGGYTEMRKDDISKNSNKKIIIIKEQGYGDDIMFSRYLKPFSELGYEVTLATHPEMINLFKASPDLDKINLVSSLPELSPSSFSFRTFLMSLPYLMLDFQENKPAPLRLSIERIKKQELKFSKPIKKLLKEKKIKVGITWSGNPKHWRDKNRSIELGLLERLFKIKDIDFFAIQKIFNKEDDELVKKYSNVHICGDLLHDFSHTALIASEMDCILSVDTSLVHLAGSLNKETYLFTPKVPDWRWGLEEHQDWYPSVQLLRQKKIDCWEEPINKIEKVLRSKTV